MKQPRLVFPISPQFAMGACKRKKNVKQKSYELQIAKDADFTDLIYNSGKTEV